MRSVLITGGTGALGQALTKRLLADPSGPGRIVIYSRGEHKQEAMARQFGDGRLRYFIGDVRDYDRLRMAMRECDIVVHAAALKIIPIAEYNPEECVKTNVIGTLNVTNAAIESGVQRCLVVSTDKACEPLNIYGACKLVGEKIAIGANTLSAGRTVFAAVRYGNVDGSTGSVMPLFKKLRDAGEPITITHEGMTRFSISMDAAVDLILYALKHMKGREVFIPKLPSFRVTDLAAAIGGNDVNVVGIRPGEKLHETLITDSEARLARDVGKYYVINGTDGDPLPNGFKYNSGTNDSWLNGTQLKELVNAL